MYVATNMGDEIEEDDELMVHPLFMQEWRGKSPDPHFWTIFPENFHKQGVAPIFQYFKYKTHVW